MDLGTVLKKVKSHVYKAKSDFKADIDLIWDNCLLYNTSTVSPETRRWRPPPGSHSSGKGR